MVQRDPRAAKPRPPDGAAPWKAPLSAGLRYVLTSQCLRAFISDCQMNPLREYMKNNPNISQAEIAEAIGVRQSTICRLVSGDSIPTLDVAFKIEDYTDGQVKARDWIK